MTRNEEYQALLQELETTPAALDGAVERALRRRWPSAAPYPGQTSQPTGSAHRS
mgnify:FL=1